jgi:hypothetical protein
MRGISIKHPWPWAILHAGKRIENRDWYCDYRGPVLIHASKLRVPKRERIPSDFVVEWRAMQEIMRRAGVDKKALPEVSFRSLAAQSGGIVAEARIVDCILPGGKIVGGGGAHPLASDPWYVGNYGIVLDDVRPVPFVAWVGATGLWEVRPKALETLARLREREGRQD